MIDIFAKNLTFQTRLVHTELKKLRGSDAYLESIGFNTLCFEEVVVCVESCEFVREHGKFDQFVLSQGQFFQQGQFRKCPIFNL